MDREWLLQCEGGPSRCVDREWLLHVWRALCAGRRAYGGGFVSCKARFPAGKTVHREGLHYRLYSVVLALGGWGGGGGEATREL